MRATLKNKTYNVPEINDDCEIKQQGIKQFFQSPSKRLKTELSPKSLKKNSFLTPQANKKSILLPGIVINTTTNTPKKSIVFNNKKSIFNTTTTSSSGFMNQSCGINQNQVRKVSTRIKKFEVSEDLLKQRKSQVKSLSPKKSVFKIRKLTVKKTELSFQNFIEQINSQDFSHHSDVLTKLDRILIAKQEIQEKCKPMALEYIFCEDQKLTNLYKQIMMLTKFDQNCDLQIREFSFSEMFINMMNSMQVLAQQFEQEIQKVREEFQEKNDKFQADEIQNKALQLIFQNAPDLILKGSAKKNAIEFKHQILDLKNNIFDLENQNSVLQDKLNQYHQNFEDFQIILENKEQEVTDEITVLEEKLKDSIYLCSNIIRDHKCLICNKTFNNEDFELLMADIAMEYNFSQKFIQDVHLSKNSFQDNLKSYIRESIVKYYDIKHTNQILRDWILQIAQLDPNLVNCAKPQEI